MFETVDSTKDNDGQKLYARSNLYYTVKPVLSGHSKRIPKMGFQD